MCVEREGSGCRGESWRLRVERVVLRIEMDMRQERRGLRIEVEKRV
jgi:hypothetical protein